MSPKRSGEDTLHRFSMNAVVVPATGTNEGDHGEERRGDTMTAMAGERRDETRGQMLGEHESQGGVGGKAGVKLSGLTVHLDCINPKQHTRNRLRDSICAGLVVSCRYFATVNSVSGDVEETDSSSAAEGGEDGKTDGGRVDLSREGGGGGAEQVTRNSNQWGGRRRREVCQVGSCACGQRLALLTLSH